MGRLQLLVCVGTLVLGLVLAVLGDGEMAAFGWFIAVIGLLGVVAPVVLTRASRRDR